jgi:hypothetical protein
MSITLPSTSNRPAFAVVVSMAICTLNLVLLAVVASIGFGLIAAGMGAATYWLVYRKLATDPAAARPWAIGLAIVHAFFAIVSIALRNPLFFLLDAAASGCLVYAFFQLRKPVTA